MPQQCHRPSNPNPSLALLAQWFPAYRFSALWFAGSLGSKPSIPISYLLPALLGFRISRYILKLFIYSIYYNVQRVGVSEVTVAVVSQLGAKLTSTDRGQALEVIVGS